MKSALPWYALLLPLVSAGAITLFTHRLKTLSSLISVAAVLGSFLCSCLIFGQKGLSASELKWIDFCTMFSVPFGFVLDDLSRIMIVLVSAFGALMHIYSLGYIPDDASKSRTLVVLSLIMS